MIDLKFNYILPSGIRIFEEYTTIMEFTDAVEEGVFTDTYLNYTDVNATFFEKNLLNKKFDTILELYNHCIKIIT